MGGFSGGFFRDNEFVIILVLFVLLVIVGVAFDN